MAGPSRTLHPFCKPCPQAPTAPLHMARLTCHALSRARCTPSPPAPPSPPTPQPQTPNPTAKEELLYETPKVAVEGEPAPGSGHEVGGVGGWGGTWGTCQGQQ